MSEQYLEDQLQAFRDMWNDLHTFAAHYTDTPMEEDALVALAWLNEWVGRLPAGCECSKEWIEIVTICPPPVYEGGFSLFCWTLAAHDRVNLLLEKPVFNAISKNHILITSLND